MFTQRMKRVQIVVCCLLPFTVSTANAGGYYCDLLTVPASTLRPSRFIWTKEVFDNIPVHDQCSLGVCWLDSGMDVLTVHFRATGVLQAEESLSLEYYFMKSVYDRIALATDDQSFHEILDRALAGGTFGGVISLVKKYGIVTERQFQESIRSGSRLKGKSSNAAFEYWSDFVDSKPLAGRHDQPKTSAWKIYSEMFDGVTEIQAKKTPELKTWYYSRDREYITDTLDMIDEKIIETVNDDRVVQVTLHGVPQSISREISESGVYNPSMRSLKYRTDSRHAVTVVGYRLDPRGKISHYLVKNSWGKTFGEGGYYTVNRAFMLKYLELMSTLDK